MPSKPPVHQAPGQPGAQERRRRFDQERGSAAARGYDRTWQRLRLQVLAEEPLCRFCLAAGRLTEAREVDHVVPIARAPELRLDRSNLRPLCTPCHSGRTASEQARGGMHAGGGGPGGTPGV